MTLASRKAGRLWGVLHRWGGYQVNQLMKVTVGFSFGWPSHFSSGALVKGVVKSVVKKAAKGREEERRKNGRQLSGNLLE